MSETPTIDANAHAFFEEYQRQEADLDELFDRSTKVLQETLRRVEESMFSGMQYIPGDIPSSDTIKAVKELGKVINESAAVKLRMDKEARSKAAKMTLNEKIDQVRGFIKSLSPDYRADLLAEFAEEEAI